MDSEVKSGDARRMRPEHLTLLVCPVCHSHLELIATQGNLAEKVICRGCDRVFPVADDLPVLLAGRAGIYIHK